MSTYGVLYVLCNQSGDRRNVGQRCLAGGRAGGPEWLVLATGSTPYVQYVRTRLRSISGEPSAHPHALTILHTERLLFYFH